MTIVGRNPAAKLSEVTASSTEGKETQNKDEADDVRQFLLQKTIEAL